MKNGKTAEAEKAVLITGCSSGIGLTVSLFLAKNNYLVLATVRKQKDAQRLREFGISKLVPLCPLDLTVPAHIENIYALTIEELKKRNCNGLYALINNAGGGSPAPIELLSFTELEIELKTRVIGPVALVQKFLPQLRQGKGRIIWIMTPALIPTPFVVSIHACDFAVNCIARTLEIELKPWNIPNIMIKCGGIKTPAGLRTVEEVEKLLKSLSVEKRILYEEILRDWTEDMAKFDQKRTDSQKVAEVILKALRAQEPRRRYSVGYMSTAANLLELFPQALTDRILKSRF